MARHFFRFKVTLSNETSIEPAGIRAIALQKTAEMVN